MFSIHKGSGLPIFWDVENLTIVNCLIQLVDKYQYKNDEEYKKQMDEFKHCTSLSLSVCGFYLFVGMSNGVIIKINTEKGLINRDFKYKSSSLKSVNHLFTD